MLRNFLLYSVYTSIFLVYCFFTLPLLLPTNSTNSLSNNFEVIIVLGGGVANECTLTASMESRMTTAIDLYHQRKTAKLLVTGGAKDYSGNCVEAEAMKRFALLKNVDTKDIIKESLSLNTYQNAQYSFEIMKERGFDRAVVVTSDFHIKRANIIFDEYPISYQMIPAKNKSVGMQRHIEWTKEQLLLCFHTVFGVPERFGLDIKEQKISSVLRSLAAN